MMHLKDAGPLLVSDFSAFAHHKPLEICACFWLREIPNDLCGEEAFLQLYMRQEGELLQSAWPPTRQLGGSLSVSQVRKLYSEVARMT